MAVLKGLIVDLGDVLTLPQRAECIEAMARRLGVSIDAFRTAYRRHRDVYDAGLPAEEYWRRVLRTLGHPSMANDVLATIAWLIQGDVESWTHYREEVWDLVRSFRAGGGRTAMLSNCPHEIIAHIRTERSLESWFDVAVISCEVGCSKPDPQIYETCLSRLNVVADRALFVDDRVVNIEAAAKLGIQTLHFVGDPSVGDLRLRLRGAKSSHG